MKFIFNVFRIELLGLSAILIFIMIGFSMLFPLIPQFSKENALSGINMGVVIASYPLGQFVASWIWGRVAPRLTFRTISLLSILGYSFNSLVFAFARDWWLISSVRFLSGCMTAGILVAAPSYFALLMPESSLQARYGIYGASIGAGITLGPFLSSVLSHYFNLHYLFIISGLFPVIITLPFALLLTIKNDYEKIKEKGARDYSLFPSFARNVLKFDLVFILFISFMLMYVSINLQSVLLFYLAKYMDTPIEKTGIMIFTSGILASISQAVFNRIIKVRALITLFLGLACTTLALFLLPLMKNFSAIFILVIMLSIFSAPSQPAIMTLLTADISQSTEMITYIMGLNNSAISLARILSPPINGYLLDISVSLPFWSASIISILLIIFLLMRKEKYIHAK